MRINSVHDLALRTSQLRDLGVRDRLNNELVRAICNGGMEGLGALLGDLPQMTVADVPAINLMIRGIERFSHMIQRPPDLRCDPENGRETDRAQKRAEKRERAIISWDQEDYLEPVILPQLARWMVGYGFAPVIVKEGTTKRGYPYPQMELRDPFHCYPGAWGPKGQPSDIMFLRIVSRYDIARMYPQHAFKLLGGMGAQYLNDEITGSYSGGIYTAGPNFENQAGNGIQVVEYYNEQGEWWFVPDYELVLEYIPNRCHRNQFWVFKRHAFDILKGQFDYVIGIMASMAKMNVLAQISAEDSVFTETNVIGGQKGQDYHKGRHAINYFDAGTRVEKPTNNQPYQMFQHIDRLEKQFRDGSGYSETLDGQSPISFVTGKGVEELQTGTTLEIEAYHYLVRLGLEELDSIRQETVESAYGDQPIEICGKRMGESFKETLRPASDISGHYSSRRVHGAMATWDDPTKIVVGIQLAQTGILSRKTIRENISGLEDQRKEDQRILHEEVANVLMSGLMAEASDPQSPNRSKAIMATIEMLPDSDLKQRLQKYYTPEGDEMSPEELMMAQQQLDPMAALAANGQVPDITTVLSRAELGGGAEGGVQTVGQAAA